MSTSMAVNTPQMGVFFSPPEIQSDSFSEPLSQHTYKATPVQSATMFSKTKLPSISAFYPIHSPPISPDTVVEKEPGKIESLDGVKDPQLFTDKASSPTVDSLSPLFLSSETTIEKAVDEHIARQNRNTPVHLIPSRKDYVLFASSIRPRVVDRYNANPALYISQELEYLKAYPPRFPQPIPTAGLKRAVGPVSTPAKRQRVSKPVNKVAKLPSAKRLPRSSPREPVEVSFEATHIPYSPEPKPARVTPHRDDFDFEKLSDYSPSVASIGNNGKALKTEWRGHPLNLSNDPDRHLLHEAEVNLASTLRLTCAQYLSSKRRIFAARLESLRDGREFRKTTAQQACKIDVNKASKLWTAFDKVGWFDPSHMARFK